MSTGKVRGIPRRYAEASLDAWNVTDPAQTAVLDEARGVIDEFGDGYLPTGRNILLSGATGTGKTYLACCLAKAIGERFNVRYVNSPRELAIGARDTWGKDSQQTESEYVADLVWWDLLIIDEFCTNMASAADATFVRDLIGLRYAECMPTMFITNRSFDEFLQLVGQKSFERIVEGGCKSLSFVWPSYRMKGL